MSPELVHRHSGYLAHCANGKLYGISSSFSKRQWQRKMPLITEQRRYFLATQQQAINDKNQGDDCQHISNHSSFLYSVHVRAYGAPTAGLQNLGAPPPGQHIWTIWHSDNRELQGHISQQHEKCLFEHSRAKDHTASRGCGERNSVKLYWIIWINNQRLAAETKLLSMRTRPQENAVGCRLLWVNKTPRTGRNKDRLQLSPSNKLLQICINSLKPLHLNFMAKVIWTNMYPGCLSSVFRSWQGSDSSTEADLHTGQMLHLTATVKAFSIMLKEPLFKPKSNSSLTLTDVQRATSSHCDSQVAMMMQAEKRWQTLHTGTYYNYMDKLKQVSVNK